MLPVRIAYRGTRPATGVLSLNLGGQPSGETSKVELTPGADSRHELRLDLRAFAGGRSVPISVALESQGLNLTLDARRPLIPCPRAPEGAAIDGDLGEWRARPFKVEPEMMYWEYINTRESTPPEDLALSAWIAYDERGLWVAVEVQDDVFSFPQSRAVWNWDSLQVGLDLGSDGRPNEGYDRNDIEIELGHKVGGADWCYLGAWPPGWPRSKRPGRS